jgi:uncharacterized protein with HEPN domain
MQLEAKKYLFDIKQAADLLLCFSRGKTFAELTANPLLRSAIDGQFEIIGASEMVTGTDAPICPRFSLELS